MTPDSSSQREALADLTVFHEIARALTSSLDLKSVLSTIMGQMQAFFHAESRALLLTGEPGKSLLYAIAEGPLGSRVVNHPVAYRESMAGWVAEHGQMLVLPELDSQSRIDFGLDFDIQSAICAPLRSRLQTLGVIQLFNLPPENFSEYAISFLLVLCDFAAIAIENARAFERVQEMTVLDECTGLYNLRHFENVFRGELLRSERMRTPMSLIFIDLDHFKSVNDQHGHQVGSRVLAQVASTVKSRIRRIDQAFRYGGDEFVVLLPGANKRRALEIANRLLNTFRKTWHVLSPTLQINVRASFGVSSFPEDGNSGVELLRAADLRMYQVKRSSRDGVSASDSGQLLEQPA